jgi:hypothetical protein
MHIQRGRRRTALLLVISGFRGEVDENCALLGYYEASSGNLLATLWDTLSVPYSTVKNAKKMGRTGCPGMSERNYHYSLHNSSEERSSQLYSFFNLGARWGWVVNATPRLLHSRERNPVPTLFLVYV